jgi:hypothetical protein
LIFLFLENFDRRIDPETQVATEKTRHLGLVVVRGTQVSLISPQDGVEEIANPFLPADDEVPVPIDESQT